MAQKNQKDGGELFANSKLEIFTRTSAKIILPLDFLIVVGLIYYSVNFWDVSMALNWWIYPAGIFSWTLLEYLMHRYAFHFPAKSKRGKNFVYMFHGIHHDHPKSEARLFQPPLVNIIIITILGVFFYVFMGRFALLFLAGLVTGYVLYSFIHFSIHKFKPPFAFLKPIWRHHNLHHYRFQKKGFGVSSPFWDYIFGTVPPKDITKKQ